MRLNDQQSEIVNFPIDYSSLVMAGAGSGKTTVIAHRAVLLSKSLLENEHIQMLTFSNKAAREMKERVQRVNGVVNPSIVFDTFHSYGLKLIKSDPEGFGLGPDFNLLNDTDIKRNLRMFAKEAGLPKDIAPADKKRLNPLSWLGTWSLKRQAGFDVRNVAKNKSALCDSLQKAHRLTDVEVDLAWSTLCAYESNKVSTNTLDFDDLLFMPLKRVAQDTGFLTAIRRGLKGLIVDESQDTNRIQYELFARIAKGWCAVTCVGDDDQSIYGWRGAEVSNLRRFKHQFDAHELRLEQNYRSTQSIVNAANDLICNNADRLEKTPFSTGPLGEDPALHCFDDSWGMVNAIADKIKHQIDTGRSPSEISVLYRTNRMSILLEPALRRLNIPYHVVGGMSLFDRSEVSAITNSIRLARNPRDTNALRSLTSYIDGIGAASIYAVCEWLESNDGANLYSLPDELDSVSKSRMLRLKTFMDDLQSQALLSHSIGEFVQWAIDGPMALLDREKDELLKGKRSQFLELLVDNISTELSERLAAGDKITWRDIAVEIALRDAGQTEAGVGQVTLSTIHRSKGLEWPYVLLAGVSEGILPLDSRSEISDEDAGYCHMDEERRIGYVALTRAKDVCELFHATRYAFPGSNDDKKYEPSRFVIEMGYTDLAPSNIFTEGVRQENSLDVAAITSSFKASMGIK